MSYPAGHTPSVNDGVEGLLVQVVERLDAAQDSDESALTDAQLRATPVPVSLPAALPAGTNNIGDVDVVTISAGETHIGKVSTGGDIISVTPVLDTSAYGSGQVLFVATEIPNAVRAAGNPAILQSLVLIDNDDEGVAIDLYFFDASVTLGTINDNVSISDADAAKLLGKVSIATTDYTDLGGVKVAPIKGIGLPVEAASGRSIYVAATVTGTPTFSTASDIVLKLGFLW